MFNQKKAEVNLCFFVTENMHLFFIDALFEHGDIGQIAVALCIVESVADDKVVPHLKTGIVRLGVHNTAGRLIEEGDDGHRLCPAFFEKFAKRDERSARIHDVLDKDDVLAIDRGK